MRVLSTTNLRCKFSAIVVPILQMSNVSKVTYMENEEPGCTVQSAIKPALYSPCCTAHLIKHRVI